MKKIKLILLFVLMPLFSFAQLEDTKFVITDGLDNASLKAVMENNVSLFLKACNVAVMEGEKPEGRRGGAERNVENESHVLSGIYGGGSLFANFGRISSEEYSSDYDGGCRRGTRPGTGASFYFFWFD